MTIDALIEDAVTEATAPRHPFPLYVASKMDHRGLFKDLRRKWRAQGVQIVSSWIDAGPNHDRLTPLAYAGAWIDNYREITAAKAVLCYGEARDGPLRGALVEAGIAMGQHKPVVIVGPIDFTSWGTWQYHPLVHFCINLEASLHVLRVWSGREPSP